MVKPLVQRTKSTVEAMKLKHGPVFETLPADMEKLARHGFGGISEENMERFCQEVYSPFLVALSEYLDL